MDKRSYYYGRFLELLAIVLESCAIPIVRVDKSRVTQEIGISYGENRNQKLDLIYTDKLTKKPLLIYIHGGGFVSGLTKIRLPYCIKCAEDGYFVVNVGYTLAPEAHFPEQFSDIFKVLEFVFDKAEEYNIDTSRIIVGGESAGAYFSNYLGTIAKHHELFEKLNIKFKYEDSFDVKGTILINGIFDIDSMVKSRFVNMKTFVKSFYNLTKKEYNDLGNRDISLFNSTTFIDSTNPPCVVVRGKYDLLDGGSKQLIELLTERNAEYCEFTAKGISGIHGFAIAPINKEGKTILRKTLDKVNEFVER